MRLLLRSFKLLLALVELLVDEIQRLHHVAAIAGKVLLTEDVDQLLRDVLRQLGVLSVGKRGLIRCRRDLEQIVLLG